MTYKPKHAKNSVLIKNKDIYDLTKTEVTYDDYTSWYALCDGHIVIFEGEAKEYFEWLESPVDADVLRNRQKELMDIFQSEGTI